MTSTDLTIDGQFHPHTDYHLISYHITPTSPYSTRLYPYHHSSSILYPVSSRPQRPLHHRITISPYHRITVSPYHRITIVNQNQNQNQIKSNQIKSYHIKFVQINIPAPCAEYTRTDTSNHSFSLLHTFKLLPPDSQRSVGVKPRRCHHRIP